MPDNETSATDVETPAIATASTKRVVVATTATIVVTTVLGLAANLVIQRVGSKVHKTVMSTPKTEDPSE